MNRFYLLLLNFFILLLVNTTLMAQRQISLEEFVAIALEQNYSLRISDNQQQIAGNNFSRGNAGLLPSLDLRSSFSGNLNNLDQNYENGTQIRVRNIHNTTANIGLQGSWMLFDGFSGQIRYKQLEELKSLSELNTRIAVENLVAQLASEYYFYIQQNRLFSNLQYAVDLSRERVRIEQEHFLLGSGSKVQLLQAQVNLNADSSRLERQYEVLRTSQIRLGEIMASPDLEVVHAPADTTISVNPELTYDDLLEDARNQNVHILAAQQNYSLSEYDLDLVRSARYPYLNLNSGYGFTRNTYQSGTFNNQQSWGMSYGLTLGVNIYDGKNQQRRLKNAHIELENRSLNLDRANLEVTADLLTIYNAYTNNLRLLNLETQNLEVARENLDIAFERYRLGGLSGFELREVQKDLLEAEERLLSVQYQAKIAEISLLQISGRILDFLIG